MSLLVGRELELAYLRARFAEAGRGRPQCVVVTGEPGIGKTVLVGEAAAAAEADGWQVHRLPAGRDAVPGLRRVLGDGAGGRTAVLVETGEFLDAELEQELAALADGDDRRPVLVAVCVRSGLLAPGALPTARRMTLAPLNATDLAALAASHGRSLDECERAALTEWSGGNPRYADLLALSPELPPASVPSELADLLDERLAALSPTARAAADAIAMTGGHLAVEAIAHLVGSSVAGADAALAELRRAELLGAGAHDRRLRHAALRQLVLQRAADRADPMFAAAAEQLERCEGADGVAAAELITELGRLAPAALGVERLHRATITTASAALRGNDPHRAARQLAEVLQATPEDSAQPSRAELLVLSGDSLTRTGDWRNAGAAYLKAAHLARRTDRPDVLIRAAIGMPRFVDHSHIDLQVRDLLTEALQVVPDTDQPQRALLLARMALEIPFADTAGRVALCDQALAAARAADPSTLIAVLLYRVAALQAPELSDDRAATVAELVTLAKQDGDPDLIFRATLALFGVCLEAAQMAEADAAVESLRRQAAASGARHHEAHALLRYASISFVRGQFDLALDAAQNAAGIAIADDLVDALRMAGLLIATIGYMRDDPSAAAMMRARTVTDPMPGFVYAYFLHQVGDIEDARAETYRGMAQLKDGSMPLMMGCMVTGADIADTFLDREIAETVLAPLSVATTKLAVADVVVCAGATDQFRAHALSALGRQDEAIEAFERAISLSRDIGSGPFVVRAQVGLVRSLLRRAGPGDRERADAIAAEAREQAAVFGMGAVPRTLEAAGAGAPASRPSTKTANVADGRRHVELAAADDVCTLVVDGRVTHLKRTKGLSQLATLLAAEGKEVPSARLGGAVEESAPSVRTAVLDDEARAAFRRRLADLDAQRSAATAAGDAAAEERIEQEQAAIIAELRRLTGLAGRARTFNDEDERARVNVTRTLRAAVERIFASEPDFGVHLAQSIRTGARCAYVPADEGRTWNVTIRR